MVFYCTCLAHTTLFSQNTCKELRTYMQKNPLYLRYIIARACTTSGHPYGVAT